MSKALTHETHYRARTGSHATKGSKRGVNLLGWDFEQEWMSCDQERAALIARVQQLQDMFTHRSHMLTPAQRAALGQEQIRLQDRIRAIRPKMQSLTRGMDVQRFHMEALKERVSPIVWRETYEEALRRCNEHRARVLSEQSE